MATSNNNWFSNLLPAIENAAVNVGNTVKNSAIGQAVQGKWGNILPAINTELENTGWKSKPGEDPLGKSKMDRLLAHNSFMGDMTETPGLGFGEGSQNFVKSQLPEGTILDAKGNPVNNFVPEEMGPYKRNPNTGTIAPNPNPELPNYATTQETPGTGYTEAEKAQIRNTLPPIEEPAPKVPLNPERGKTFEYSDNAPFSTNEVNINNKRGLTMDGDSIKTTQDLNQVNNTLNGYGIIDDSPKTQLTKTEKLIGSLQDKAQAIVAEQGGTIAKQDLIDGISTKLSQSINHQIPDNQIPTTADQYLSNVWKRVTHSPPTAVMPDEIPGNVVQAMKTQMNEDVKGTFGKDPQSYNLFETVARNSRNAFDEILDTKYPMASKVNNDMSDLYNARDGLTNRANQEINQNRSTAIAGKPNILSSAMKHPWAVGLATTAAAPLVAAGGIMAINALNPGKPLTDEPSAQLTNGGNNVIPSGSQNQNNQISQGSQPQGTENIVNGTISHTLPISNSITNVNDLETNFTKIQPSSDGKWSSALPNIYNLKDKNNQSIVISDGTYKALKLQLANEANTNPFYTSNNQGISQMKTANDTLDRAYTASTTINDKYNEAQIALQKIDDAMALLNNPNPGALGLPNPADTIPLIGHFGVQTMQGGLNTNYRNLLQDFNSIQTINPELHLDFSNIGSPDVAKQALFKAAQQVIGSLNIQVKNQSKSLPDINFIPTSINANQNNQITLPQIGTSTDNAPFIAHPNMSSYLPNITPAQPVPLPQ